MKLDNVTNPDCKIIVAGKTGVGKSALINFLANDQVVESGIPLTAGGYTHGIERKFIEIKGVFCQITDTEGLEVDKADEWKKILREELYDDSGKRNYHIVLYCVSAASGRIEQTELEMIKEILDSGFKEILVFTKCNFTSDEDYKKLKNEISGYVNDCDLLFSNVDSVSVKGSKTVGKTELSTVIRRLWLHL